MMWNTREVFSACIRCGRTAVFVNSFQFRCFVSFSPTHYFSNNSSVSPMKKDPNPSQLTVTKNTSQTPAVTSRRNTKILRMDPSEYEGSGVGKQKLSLMERQGEAQTVYKQLVVDDDKPGVRTDFLAFWQQDIEITPKALKRIWSSIDAQAEIKLQSFNPKRMHVLGRDLGAAHFIVARKGKVKFMGQNDWISSYRKDAKPGDDELDLPNMTMELCTMPVSYNPNYRVEAIDASGVPLRYEGLLNFASLNYVKWLSFRDSPLFNDWCLDRIYCNFAETLEHLDVSGCKGITVRGLCGAARLKKLTTLVVENLTHIKDLDVFCATLEDQRPGLTCIGTDFEKRLNELKEENTAFEKKLLEDEAAREANTINLTPRSNFETSTTTPTNPTIPNTKNPE